MADPTPTPPEGVATIDNPTQFPIGGDLYADLTEQFAELHHDNKRNIDYVTGEQCVTRLNEVLGPGAWRFEVKEHGYNEAADEFWVLGRLEVLLSPPKSYVGSEWVIREQFGSQKAKRFKETGVQMDLGFDLKGAATDSLKKCATLIGVALYLSHKEEAQDSQGQSNGQGQARRANGQSQRPQQAAQGGVGPGPHHCEECGEVLTNVNFRSGESWTPAQLAGYSRQKHGRVLCIAHYKAASDAKKNGAPATPTQNGAAPASFNQAQATPSGAPASSPEPVNFTQRQQIDQEWKRLPGLEARAGKAGLDYDVIRRGEMPDAQLPGYIVEFTERIEAAEDFSAAWSDAMNMDIALTDEEAAIGPLPTREIVARTQRLKERIRARAEKKLDAAASTI